MLTKELLIFYLANQGSANGTTTAQSAIAVTTSSVNGTLGVSPQSVHSVDHLQNANRSSVHFASSSTSLPRPSVPGRPASGLTRSRSKTRDRDPRRVSRSTAGTNASPANSDRPNTTEKKPAPFGIIGVCALDSKARSKPSRNILNRLISNGEFDVRIFGDKVILDEDVENWPVCDYLISFFSDGFPLEKAIAYERLRKPYCLNDLAMQTVLWDRRLCLMILDSFNISTPRRIEVNRDGGPRLSSPDFAVYLKERTGLRLPGAEDGTGGGILAPKKVELSDDGEVLTVDGKQLRKPFVEKPVSGEDHNIHIYFPQSAGGGGRRLFRKVNNKSSERDETLHTPRAITEPGNSYIYEQFVEAAKAEDVKAYTVGTNYCHAETRKSPVVDGIVKRNPNGKELRYITELSKDEKLMAANVVRAFGQTVCGFDLLRSDGKSYVIDVNGFSFVKDNNEYYDQCAKILRELFMQERQRLEAKVQALTQDSKSLDDADQIKHNSSHRSIKDIFKSPSMSKLTPHHHHHHRHQHSKDGGDGLPMSSPPSIENANAANSQIPASQLVPAPASTGDNKSIKSDLTSHAEKSSQPSPIPPPASKAQWRLKGMVAVVRHADRTPKQKFKFTFHTRPFVDLLRGHQEEVLLVGEAALHSVLEAVNLAMEEGKEDMTKLQLLKTSLVKKGSWAGTKVQIKPMFRKRRGSTENKETPNEDPKGPKPAIQRMPSIGHRDSNQTVTLSRISAAENNLVLDKLQLIIKWGGEPTHSARYQAQDLGEGMRNDLLLMNRECLDNVCVFSSSERRVTTSAQIFASTFLNDKNLAQDFIHVRKDLLDDSNAAKDDMDKVKKKLKQLLREGDSAPPEFTWPTGSPEPFLVVRRVVELMKFHHQVMSINYQQLHNDSNTSQTASPTGSLTSTQMVSNIQSRWCSGEDADLFKERWEKLFKEFTDADKVDPSKISELYDTLKFDALHNRQFLEWVFTPDIELAEAATVAPTSAPSTLKPNPVDQTPESYFNLYRSPTSQSKVKNDARLSNLRELYTLAKTLFDYIGPQEYGISPEEKLSIGLLTSLPLLKEIVHDLEEMQASDGGQSFFYFTKESHIYTLLNCIIEGGIKTKIERKNIPELDYLSQINFELYESENHLSVSDEEQGKDRYNYSIRITLSPGCHTFDPLDLSLDSKHCIGIAPRRSLTNHVDYKDVLETLRAKFHTVKLPKSFVAINLSEISPQLFGPVRKSSTASSIPADELETPTIENTEVGEESSADKPLHEGDKAEEKATTTT
ncbi:hypothetical protein BT63DRAFT_379703 [Microthyrium microscopicum]|uniref:Inositol hexakisphosphate and diphosphoinositol-pentakisphosphate kinase n=1 Tax=Microthyrium microscopicum TaxID=703497 RepID=A0A6A6TWY2_9PEZI|nr:hypothetical protein BT63DRAFT_379703 [Microthyrium microscopicum]